MRARKLDRASEALDLLEPHEPASTMLVAPILENGLGRTVYCWVAESEDGVTGGLIAIVRYCVDSWVCRPFVLDRAAAPVLAAIADRSPGLNVHGPAEHVDPLIPHLGCAGDREAGDFLRLPPGAFIPELASDRRIRLAELADLGQLVELYSEYEFESLPAIRLRSLLRETLSRRMILAAEQQGRLVGAHRLVGWSRRWAMWDELTVLPEARRRGVGWALVHRGAMETGLRDRRWMTPRNASNPMRFPERLRAECSEWAIVSLTG